MPVTIPLLACFFEEYAQTNCLENFVSVFGRRFYGLAETDETLVLEKRSWKVPEIVDGVVRSEREPLFRGRFGAREFAE